MTAEERHANLAALFQCYQTYRLRLLFLHAANTVPPLPDDVACDRVDPLCAVLVLGASEHLALCFEPVLHGPAINITTTLI